MIKLIKDKQNWIDTLNTLPDFTGKVYCLYEYFEALQKNNEGIPAAIYFTDNDARIFYPFLLKQIPLDKNYYDIESPYGYAGQICFNCNKENINSFAKEFRQFTTDNKIVSEFIRFNPFYDFSKLFSANDYSVILNRKTVSIKLNKDFSRVIESCSSPRKRNYKKGLKSLSIIISNQTKDLEVFKSLYFKNMRRLNADKYYYFSDNYFNQLMNMPEDNIKIAIVYTQTGMPLASGLFLFDELSAHYHLGASNMEYKEFQPAVFMIMEIAKYACKLNKQIFHLGGGLSLDPTDNLFRFKKGFSPITCDFYIGKKIYNSELYNNFSNEWQLKTGKKPVKLLHYHDL